MATATISRHPVRHFSSSAFIRQLRSRRSRFGHVRSEASGEALAIYERCLDRLRRLAGDPPPSGLVVFRSDLMAVPVNREDVRTAARLLRRQFAGLTVKLSEQNGGGRLVRLITLRP